MTLDDLRGWVCSADFRTLRSVPYMEWAEFFSGDDDRRRVDRTEVGRGFVSTVFLGTPVFTGMTPQFFETMTFADGLDVQRVLAAIEDSLLSGPTSEEPSEEPTTPTGDPTTESSGESTAPTGEPTTDPSADARGAEASSADATPSA